MSGRRSCSDSPIEGIADLGPARRVWAVSSIHGAARRLRRVNDQIARALRHGDRLVYLGNYLGGENGDADIRDTLDALLAFRTEQLARGILNPCDIVHLKGRQEEMWHRLLQLQFADNPAEILTWMLDHGVGATLRAYGGDVAAGQRAASGDTVALARWTNSLRTALRRAAGHDALLASLRRAAYSTRPGTADPGLLFVHAGLAPDLTLAGQGDLFWWGTPPVLSATYAGFAMVVCGYARAQPGLETSPFATVLDGGCGRGGTLLAACFDPAGRVVDLLEG